MFTWICPQCGREVPPAYTECPDCTKKAAEGGGANPPVPPPGPWAPPPAAYPPAPPPPQYQQVPQQAPQYYQPPAQPQYQQPAPPQYQPPPPQYQQTPGPPPPPNQPGPPPPGYYLPQQPHPRRTLTLPVWLMTILFAVGVAGVVFAVVSLMSSNKGSAGSGPTPSASVESPAAKPGTKASPMQKYIEIAGVRFTTDAKKKTAVQFILINHSTAEIVGLAGNVTVWGSTKKSEEDAQGSFSFTTNMGALESKELTVPFTTKLKIYALADWQNINTDVQITAPVQ
jgi:hypothetical protein